MSNAVAFFPQTPTPTRLSTFPHDHRPTKSSPLAQPTLGLSSSPGPISPIAEAQARRRSLFKSRAASSSRTANSPVKSVRRPAPIPFTLGPALGQPAAETSFLRERFKSKCFERARRAREKGIQRRRDLASDANSDGFDADMDMDEQVEADDDGGFDDELFRRIVTNEKRKLAHAFALSYELDVGSSFDPDMEDVAEWERHVQSPSTPIQPLQLQQEEGPLPPDEFDDLNLDEFDEFDGDSTWVDEYIASLPVEPEEDEVAAAAAQKHSWNQSRGTSGSVGVGGMSDVVME